MLAIAFFSVPSTFAFRKQGQKHPQLSVEGGIAIEKIGSVFRKPKKEIHLTF